jgi:hypothetical protein
MRSAVRRLASLLAILLVAHLAAGTALARCATPGAPAVGEGRAAAHPAHGHDRRAPAHAADAARDAAPDGTPASHRGPPPTHCLGPMGCAVGILPSSAEPAAAPRIAAALLPTADDGAPPSAAPAPEPPPPRA